MRPKFARFVLYSFVCAGCDASDYAEPGKNQEEVKVKCLGLTKMYYGWVNIFNSFMLIPKHPVWGRATSRSYPLVRPKPFLNGIYCIKKE